MKKAYLLSLSLLLCVIGCRDNDPCEDNWAFQRPNTAIGNTASIRPTPRLNLTGNEIKGVLITGDDFTATHKPELYFVGGLNTLIGTNQPPQYPYHTATRLATEDVVLLTGGLLSNETYSTQISLFTNNGLGLQKTTDTLLQGRAGHTATLWKDNTIVLIGGNPTDASLSTVTLDTTSLSSKVENLGISLSVNRQFHTATKFGEDFILIVGGLDPNSTSILDKAEVLDLSTNTITELLQPQASIYHQAVYLPEQQQILLTGGQNNLASGVTDKAYLFDGSNFKQDSLTLQVPRSKHTMTVLPDINTRLGERVVIIGGQEETGNALASIEVYDPTVGNDSGAFVLLNTQLTHARYGHAAIYIPHISDKFIAQVLVYGGYSDATLQDFVEEVELLTFDLHACSFDNL